MDEIESQNSHTSRQTESSQGEKFPTDRPVQTQSGFRPNLAMGDKLLKGLAAVDGQRARHSKKKATRPISVQKSDHTTCLAAKRSAQHFGYAFSSPKKSLSENAQFDFGPVCHKRTSQSSDREPFEFQADTLNKLQHKENSTRNARLQSETKAHSGCEDDRTTEDRHKPKTPVRTRHLQSTSRGNKESEASARKPRCSSKRKADEFEYEPQKDLPPHSTSKQKKSLSIDRSPETESVTTKIKQAPWSTRAAPVPSPELSGAGSRELSAHSNEIENTPVTPVTGDEQENGFSKTDSQTEQKSDELNQLSLSQNDDPENTHSLQNRDEKNGKESNGSVFWASGLSDQLRLVEDETQLLSLEDAGTDDDQPLDLCRAYVSANDSVFLSTSKSQVRQPSEVLEDSVFLPDARDEVYTPDAYPVPATEPRRNTVHRKLSRIFKPRSLSCLSNEEAREVLDMQFRIAAELNHLRYILHLNTADKHNSQRNRYELSQLPGKLARNLHHYSAPQYSISDNHCHIGNPSPNSSPVGVHQHSVNWKQRPHDCKSRNMMNSISLESVALSSISNINSKFFSGCHPSDIASLSCQKTSSSSCSSSSSEADSPTNTDPGHDVGARSCCGLCGDSKEEVIRDAHNTTYTVQDGDVLPLSRAGSTDPCSCSSFRTSSHRSRTEVSASCNSSAIKPLQELDLKPPEHFEHLYTSPSCSNREGHANFEATPDTGVILTQTEEKSMRSCSEKLMPSISDNKTKTCIISVGEDSLSDESDEQTRRREDVAGEDSSGESRYSSCSSEELRHQFHLNSHLYNVLGCEDWFHVSINAEHQAGEDDQLKTKGGEAGFRTEECGSPHDLSQASRGRESPANPHPRIKQQPQQNLDAVSHCVKKNETLDPAAHPDSRQEENVEKSDSVHDRECCFMSVPLGVDHQDPYTDQTYRRSLQHRSNEHQAEEKRSFVDSKSWWQSQRAHLLPSDGTTLHIEDAQAIPRVTHSAPKLTKSFSDSSLQSAQQTYTPFQNAGEYFDVPGHQNIPLDLYSSCCDRKADTKQHNSNKITSIRTLKKRHIALNHLKTPITTLPLGTPTDVVKCHSTESSTPTHALQQLSKMSGNSDPPPFMFCCAHCLSDPFLTVYPWIPLGRAAYCGEESANLGAGIDDFPGMVYTNDAGLALYPAAVDPHPEKRNFNPEEVDANPEKLDVNPGARNTDPETLNANPEEFSADPGEVNPDPEKLYANLVAMNHDPEQLNAHSISTMTNSGVLKGNPEKPSATSVTLKPELGGLDANVKGLTAEAAGLNANSKDLCAQFGRVNVVSGDLEERDESGTSSEERAQAGYPADYAAPFYKFLAVLVVVVILSLVVDSLGPEPFCSLFTGLVGFLLGRYFGAF